MFSNNTTTLVEFCAGYCGIGIGLARAIPTLRTIAYCEREAFAVANMAAKIEAGFLDAAPIYADLRDFPYAEFHGLVDIAAAGIPCQPHSHAGKRKGGADERFLFDDWLKGLELMQPRYILIENVEGLLSSKMPDGSLCIGWTVERLEAMGYRVEAGIFSAEECGAPHRRKRVFILAHNQRQRVEEQRGEEPSKQKQHPVRNTCCDVWPARPGQQQYDWEPPRVVNAGLQRPEEQKQQAAGIEQPSERVVGDTADIRQCGFSSDTGEVTTNEKREKRRVHEPSGASALSNDDAQQNSNSEERGLSESNRKIKSPVGLRPYGSPDRLDYAELYESCDNRTDELRLLGNGVVPATAEKAWRTLYARIKR